MLMRKNVNNDVSKDSPIHLVHRAPTDRLTKAENNVIIFFKDYCVIHVNLTFALSFPFHELHVWSMQNYEKLILHVQIEQDF